MNAPYSFPPRFQDMPRAAKGHMPFKGHRTVAEVDEERARKGICRALGKDRGRR